MKFLLICVCPGFEPALNLAALVNQQGARFLTFDVNHFTAMRRTTCVP